MKPLIGITVGDPNGIGPEVVLKALSEPAIYNMFVPVVYASKSVIGYYRKLLGYEQLHLNIINDFEAINAKRINMVSVGEGLEPEPGRITPEAGAFALACLERCTADVLSGKLSGLVTAPINKANIQSEVFSFPGHTEYLAAKFGAKQAIMLMCTEGLVLGLVTGHVPINKVSGLISQQTLTDSYLWLEQSLKSDFSINKPKIAVLGINPHAGDDGVIGSDDNNVVIPVVAKLRQQGKMAFGPYPADGFFAHSSYSKFDGVLAMYHDQGLIPFKMLAYPGGVNFTAGLTTVRTSPAHGTAYDIAGKNLADATSMREAIYLAIKIIMNRVKQK